MINPRPVLAAVLLACATPSSSNPVLQHDVDAMNARPREWLDHPTPELRASLAQQFAWYGVSPGLLSRPTIALLERHFDEFAPLLVEAQTPPLPVDEGLQHWFRRRADHKQANAMTAALRAWLASKEFPRETWGFEPGSTMEKAQAAENKMRAAEALGDWHDAQALPALKSLQEEYDGSVLRASIRRITDPDHADPITPELDGTIKVRRPLAELDSMVVLTKDTLAGETMTWRPGPQARQRIYASLERHSRPHEGRRKRTSDADFTGSLQLIYRDGRRLELERNDSWRVSDNGRLRFEFEFANENLERTLRDELVAGGVAIAGPRFVSESVTMSVEKDELRIHGIYRFEGQTEHGIMALAYPFPQDPTLGSPRLDRATLVAGKNAPLEVFVDTTSLPWRILMQPGEASVYELSVQYRQPRHGKSATYLLRSALEWGQPLREAWFQIITDRALGTPMFDYQFHEVAQDESHRRFLYQASPFRPSRDLVVRW